MEKQDSLQDNRYVLCLRKYPSYFENIKHSQVTIDI